MEKALILDRDGVINVDYLTYVKSTEQFHCLPGSLRALGQAKAAGFRLGLATNQSGIGRGLFSLAQLDAIHKKMQSELSQFGAEFDAIAYCPHAPEDGCVCRKPLPGLFVQLEASLGQSLKGCWYVGDSTRDMLAAEAYGLQPILVLTGNGFESLADPELPKSTRVFDDLTQVVFALTG